MLTRHSFAAPRFLVIASSACVAFASAAAACGGTSGSNAGGTGSGSDGGASAEGSVGDDGGDEAASTASVCTSGMMWTHGTLGSSSMRPGDTCITCHSMSGGGAPTFYVAGTVYPTEHEPTLCNGIAGATIVVTDAKNQTFTLTSNSVGNFACGPVARNGFPACANFTYPFTAKTVNKTTGATNAMIDPQKTGDCNSCHTEHGLNNAPGRIEAP
jgi:hypothetical protein